MNEGDIQFGEIEHKPIETAVRPDQDRAFAVCPYGAPDGGQLRIYMALDAFADIETHAHSDTSVELGGVLVGKPYRDEHGRPFVLVQDSLRAKHYESTASRFTYTHQTWGEITREKDELFPDLDIVGWYHTHPGWGVFLSGHDTFIHEHFFAHAMQIAYVVDPINEDRGCFQWMQAGAGRSLPQTSGFYVFAPRQQRAALEETVARVEHSRKPEMVAAAAGGPIILQTPPSRPSWTGAAAVVLGLILLLQTWVLSAIYRSLADRDPDSAAAKARSEEQAKLAKAVEELERDRLRLEAERRIIFDLTGRLDLPGGPISKQWEEVRKGAVLEAERAVKFERESAVAKAAAEAIQKKNEELRARIERQQKEIEDLKPYKSKSEELTRRVGNFEKKEKELEEAAHLLKRYENLRERLDRLEESESAAEFWRNVTLMGAVPLALLGWALATFAIRRQSEPPAAPDGAGLPTGASGPPNIGPPAAGGAVRVLSNDVVPPGVAPPGPTGYGSPAPPPGASPRTDEMRFD